MLRMWASHLAEPEEGSEGGEVQSLYTWTSRRGGGVSSWRHSCCGWPAGQRHAGGGAVEAGAASAATPAIAATNTARSSGIDHCRILTLRLSFT